MEVDGVKPPQLPSQERVVQPHRAVRAMVSAHPESLMFPPSQRLAQECWLQTLRAIGAEAWGYGTGHQSSCAALGLPMMTQREAKGYAVRAEKGAL